MDSKEITQRVASAKRKNRLKWYEDEIRKAVKSVASIFLQLRNDPEKPWEETHATFDEYCREVHGFTSSRIRQITDAESMRMLLSDRAPELAPVLAKMPERQMREIIATPDRQRISVLKKVVRKSNGAPIKTRAIRQTRTPVVIDAATGKPDAAPAKVCPTCHRAL